MLNNPVKWHFKVIFLYKRATILQFCGLKKNCPHTLPMRVCVHSLHYMHTKIQTEKKNKLKSNIESEQECTIYIPMFVFRISEA